MNNQQRLNLFSKTAFLRLSVLFFAVIFAATGLKAEDLNNENFESGTLGTWSQYSVMSNYNWRNVSFSGNRYAEMNGYNANDNSEDWLISPALDLDDLNKVFFEFRNAKNYSGPQLQLLVSTNYYAGSNPNTASWSSFTNQVNWSTGSNTWADTKVDISFFAEETVHIAFKYTSTPTNAARWQVDDLRVYGTPKSKIGYAEALTVYTVVPENPIPGHPFKVMVASVDRFGVPVPVTSNVTFSLNLSTGNYPLVGAGQVGTIVAGEYMATFGANDYAEVTYPATENIVINPLVTGPNPQNLGLYENVIKMSQSVSLVSNIYNKGHQGVVHPTFEVHGVNPNGTINPNFDGYDVTISITGGGASGTFTATAEEGIATFDNVTFTSIANYTVQANSMYVPNPSPAYNVRVIAKPTVTGIVVPQYVKGAGQFPDFGGTGRIPSWSLVEIRNLHPYTEYTYLAHANNWGTPPSTSYMPGQNFHFDYMTNSYVAGETPLSLSEAASHSTMMTDGDGTMRVWVSLIPTNSNIFQKGNEFEWVVALGAKTGDVVVQAPLMQQSVALDFGTQVCDPYDGGYGGEGEGEGDIACFNATGIYEINSPFSPRNFMVLRDDMNNVISTAIVQDEGAILQNPNPAGGWYGHQSVPFYRNVDGYRNSDGSWAREAKNGSWATIIPNFGSGVYSIEEYNQQGTLLAQPEIGGLTAYKDDDGIWAGIETGQVGGGSANPIPFETPQIHILAPMSGEDVCNMAPDDLDENREEMLYNLLWESYGIEELNVYYSINGSPWELVHYHTDARDGIENWDIFREIFDNENVELLFESVEHPEVTAETGIFYVYDAPTLLDNANSTVICYSNSGAVSVNAIGSNLKYQWYKDGQMVPGETSQILELTDVDYSDAATYYAMVTGHPACPPLKSGDITIYIARETEIYKQPEDQTVVEGGTARYEVIPHVNGVPEGYQIDVEWYEYFENAPDVLIPEDNRFEGTRSSLMSIRNVVASDFGRKFYARIYGLCFMNEVYDTDIVTLEKLDFGWVSEPEDATACTGDGQIDVEFFGEASTTLDETILYQWYKDGIKLTNGTKYTGTTEMTLTVIDVDENDKGSYWLVATLEESGKVIQSMTASLDVSAIPVINNISDDLTVNEGETAIIQVDASGDNLEYQWYDSEGLPIENGLEATLIFTSVTEEDAGAYYVVVSNPCGDVTSEAVTLTVTVPGDITSVTDANSLGLGLGNIMPNPVNGDAQFRVSSSNRVDAHIVITDVTGRQIATIFDGTLSVGNNTINFNSNSINLVSGTYYYTLKANAIQLTNRFTVVK